MRVTRLLGVSAVLWACVDSPLAVGRYADAGGADERLELDAGPSKPPTRPSAAGNAGGAGGRPAAPAPVTRSLEGEAPTGGNAGAGGAGKAPAFAADGGGTARDRGGGSRPAQPGALLISELMIDPKAVSDAEGEWLELHNPGSEALNVQGCVLGDGSERPQPLEDRLLVPPGAFVTIARSEHAGFAPTVVAAFSLKNGADVLSLSCDGVSIDRVAYDEASGYPISPGVAMSLDGRSLDAVRNDVAAAWCPAIEAYATDLGSPGEKNPPCPTHDDAGLAD
jgi:hypothetical protein